MKLIKIKLRTIIPSSSYFLKIIFNNMLILTIILQNLAHQFLIWFVCKFSNFVLAFPWVCLLLCLPFFMTFMLYINHFWLCLFALLSTVRGVEVITLPQNLG